ncbi:concanavalin A-like lectin/glucanase domain-containing protein [Podospora aff. communis PSN243]|uniref:Concanavalin A-like lectin/glucanase domain-containing protein n=1 Tax=Podospora aff. communis PSN243 TaxID=3040156 RepID=A0AAV9G6B2_9PEZI|nr:concanavalin A-like lectin/glucanase domain-containing protein [Podospora aff. communis PSN243]
MLFFGRDTRAQFAALLALRAQQVAGAYDATVCDQKSYTSSENLTFNPNAWNPDGQGFQCISIHDSPPAFDATWAWVDKPRSVHSYPHVKLTTPALPTRLSNISALLLSAQWSMGPGSRPRPVLNVDSSGLSHIGASANVAFDIFADRNPRFAGSARTAETEVMIWLGRFGDAQPLGFASESACLTITLANTDFMLYKGQNQRGTDVFTWVATSNVASFAAEVSPLLQSLWRNGLISPNSQIGLVEFGSEAFHSPDNVTFSASGFAIHLLPGPAPGIVVESLPTACSIAVSVDSHRRASWVFSALIIGTVTAALYVF